MLFISPTGSDKIRNDSWGGGRYGASRKRVDGSSYPHPGTDYETVEGQAIVLPASATYERIILPYADNRSYTGAMFTNAWCRFRLLYFDIAIVSGKSYPQGELIGYAQDISRRYGVNSEGEQMGTHVHFEVISIDPEVLVTYEKQT